MRIWMILLLCVSTLAALGLGFWFLERRNDEILEPALDLPTEGEFVELYYGAQEGFECLVFRSQSETGDPAFHDDQLGRQIPGAEAWKFVRVWMINHREHTVPFDCETDSIFAFETADGESHSRSLKGLAGTAVAPGQAEWMVVAALGQFNRKSLEERAFVEFQVAIPRSLDSESVEGVRHDGRALKLSFARARARDLDAYAAAPSGRMQDLLIKRADSKSQEQASSGR